MVAANRATLTAPQRGAVPPSAAGREPAHDQAGMRPGMLLAAWTWAAVGMRPGGRWGRIGTMPHADDEPQDLQADVWDRLWAARQEYLSATRPEYDEVLVQVQQRVAEAGSVGKADIGALVLWKRLDARTRWAKDLMNTPDEKVRAIAQVAVQAVSDPNRAVPDAAQDGRAALTKLPGFARGDALASAVLLAAAPARMAVYDRRAQAGLESLGLVLTARPRRYRRYMAILEQLREVSRRHGQDMSARDVDTALYQLGG